MSKIEEKRDYGRKGSADYVKPSIRKKLALISLTSGGRSIDIVRSRTQATEFFFIPYVFRKRERSKEMNGTSRLNMR
jgi:hypothetical protein